MGGSISPGGGTYDEGASVTLTATPATGYRFDRWSGDVSGNVTSTTITMNADKSVTANFIKVYTLTVTVSPAEGGTVSPGGGTYDEGTVVTLTATPATGYVFDQWAAMFPATLPRLTSPWTPIRASPPYFVVISHEARVVEHQPEHEIPPLSSR